MPIYNSKQSGMVFLQSRIVSFYNETVLPNDTDFKFYYEGDSTPTYQLSVSQFAGKYRCLQYKNFNSYAYQYTVCPYVLYVDSTSNSCSLLFETNFVSCQQNEGNVMCTFWSTLGSGKDCKKTCGTDSYLQFGKVFEQSSTKYYYKYDPANIYKVNIKNMDSFQLAQKYKNIFCAAKISLVTMQVENSNTSQKFLQDVAIIDSLPIVLQQSQAKSPVFDFSLQGSGGGGIKQHNHIPHIDGTGFAFAVFHPGTSMPQLSWSSV